MAKCASDLKQKHSFIKIADINIHKSSHYEELFFLLKKNVNSNEIIVNL